MKRLLLSIILLSAIGLAAPAQNLTMSLQGKVQAQGTDLDARTYYPVYDLNDNLCALLKVTVTNPLKNPLVLNVGGLSVVKREEKENGEIWFYVPAQVRNLLFSCAGYAPMDAVPVNLKAGVVYRLTIANDAMFTTVTTVSVKSNYLKLQVFPPDAIVSIGQTQSYEIASVMLTDGSFIRQLDYGDYYYKVEHRMYETEEGMVNVSAANETRSITLAPAYNTLEVRSSPESGANVFINGEFVGQTPVRVPDKIMKGQCSIRLMHKDYHQCEETVTLSGDGSEQIVTIDMSPQYGTVTCRSDDPTAQIWVDQDFKGTGSWTGRLSSTVTHVIEARKDNHQSQSKSFSVGDGQVKTETVGAPVPLFASLNIVSEPAMAKVLIDGKYVGEAPLLTQILMGEHSVSLSKEGYMESKTTVVLAHNEEKELKITLQEGQVYVPVTLTTDEDADIYVDGRLMGKGRWSGQLPEGLHSFVSSKEFCTDGSMTRTVKGPGRITLGIPPPRPQTARINVLSNKSGAKVYIDGDYVGVVPYSAEVNAGTRTISVEKDKFRMSTRPKTVTLQPDDNEYAYFILKKDWSQTWLLKPQSKSSHFLELQYGFGIPVGQGKDLWGNNPEYVGLEYGFVKSGIGFRTSAQYGIDTEDIGLTVGPAFRLTKSYSDLDLQFYLGAGGVYSPEAGGKKFGMMYDAGLRFAFQNANMDDFCWYSFSAGVKYFRETVIPTFGVSIFPGGIFSSDGLYSTQYDFARTFIDMVGGYGINRGTYHLGLTYAHVKTRIGYYGTLLYELDDVGSLAVGPVFRLTGDSSFMDLQLYGGIGLNASSIYGTSLLGDAGLRFGWASNSRLSWWNFNLGCMFFGDEIVPTIGLGFGISLVGICGLLGAGLGVLASGGA